MAIDTLIAYVGVYGSVEDAEADYQLVKELHVEAGLIDGYDAAVIERRDGGKTKIVKKHETPTRVGGVLGGGVGLATGLVVALFPFAAIGGGLLATTTAGGAILGAVAGHAAAGMSRHDLKELGEQLDTGEAGLVVVAVADMGAKVQRAMKRAEKLEEKQLKADTEELERRMMKGEFSFDDFLKSYKMLRRMGPLQGVLKMIPGLGKQLEGLDQVDEKQLAQVEAIILSMTPHERRVPHVIDGSRRQRLAAGSGTSLQQVNQLIEGRKQMAKMMKMMGSGKMPSLPGTMPAAPSGKPRPSATRKSASKRKKKAKR